MQTHPDGIFEAMVPAEFVNARADEAIDPASYRLRIRFADGETFKKLTTPTRLRLCLPDYDLYLLGEGTDYQNYEKLGAHCEEVARVKGVHFAVWAPNAKRVSVVGDFDSWDGRVHPMRNRGASGVWEIFLPGLGEGTLYKFEILRARTAIWV